MLNYSWSHKSPNLWRIVTSVGFEHSLLRNYASKVVHAFFISSTFISNAKLKLAKNQAKAKLLMNFCYLKIVQYSKKCAKTKCTCFNEIMWLIIMKMRLKMKMDHINRNKPRRGHKYTKYKMCLSMMMAISNKQHLNSIWNWLHGKVKQHWDWVEKKRCL